VGGANGVIAPENGLAIRVFQAHLWLDGLRNSGHPNKPSYHQLSRQDQIKMAWFHKIKASVDLMMDDKISQTRHLQGDKFRILKGLAQLEDEFKQANA
jgi:hypothetical protein